MQIGVAECCTGWDQRFTSWTQTLIIYGVFSFFFLLSFFMRVQVVLHPTPNSPKQSELHKMTVTKACPDQDLKIKLAIRMDKPQNMKHCGWEARCRAWCGDAPVCLFILPCVSYRTPAPFSSLASFLVTYHGKILWSALLPLVDDKVYFRFFFFLLDGAKKLKILKAA